MFCSRQNLAQDWRFVLYLKNYIYIKKLQKENNYSKLLHQVKITHFQTSFSLKFLAI